MKKHSTKALCLLLILVMLVSALPLCANATQKEYLQEVYSTDTFTMYIDENGNYRFKGSTGDIIDTDTEADFYISSASDYYKSQGKNYKDIASTSADNLPTSVDLSDTKYFPPVGDQGGLGSCATFSCVYYQFSYEFNKQLDRQATFENTMSPQIVFNLINGDAIDGTSYETNYIFLKQHGAVPMSVLTYSDKDQLNWYAEEKYWGEALKYRLDSYCELENIGVDGKEITSPSDPDLIPLKTALNDGKIVGYSTQVHSWVGGKLKQNANAPANAAHKDEHVILYKDGYNGPHRMAIVGYNDEIWTDLNNNDRVDSGEMGALKIVNSWGSGYCNQGFVWVAYDALNKVSCVDGGYNGGSRSPIIEYMTTINVREYNPEGSQVYFAYTLNTANRIQHEVVVTAEKDGTIKSHQVFYGSAPYKNESNDGGFDGSENATDGTFCVPLDLTFEDFDPSEFNEYSFSVTVRDTNKDSSPVTIKEAKIVNTATGKSYYTDYLLPESVDGSETTFVIKDSESKNKVIYYTGYDSPTLHYSSDGSTFTAVKMQATNERIGSTHKYVIKNAEENLTLYFSDGFSDIDDNSGNYYTATQHLNFYRTKDAKESVKITDVCLPSNGFDIGVRFMFDVKTTGGYEPFNYQYTIKRLETNETKFIPYDSKYEKSHVFYYAGLYEIVVEVTDQAGDVYEFTKTMDIIDMPFIFKDMVSNQKTHFVGDTASFTAYTECEKVISRGPQKSLYKFDVKNSDGELVYTITNKSTKYHLGEKWSIIDFEYIPEKSGSYTLTVSSTDDSKEYAEYTIDFTVYDKTYGDSNSDGMVSVMDATHIQRMLAGNITADEINNELADCDANSLVDVLDATLIQRYIAQLSGTKNTGNIIEYIPPVKPTDPPTEPPTDPPTTPPTEEPVTKNTVTFTNSFNWSGTIKCYYWSDENTSMTVWPGATMNAIGVNDFGQTMYTFEVPQGAKYLIFTNGSSQTTDITYGGGEVRYYPISTTDSKGHNLIKIW